MMLVLDASAFFIDIPFDGPLATTPAVVDELKDHTARCRFATLQAAGLQVRDPSPASIARVQAAAVASGDAPVLSGTDTGILALALDLAATVCTDDFAVQNVAHRLQVPVRPILQRQAKARQWRYRCAGCGRYYKKEGTCVVCGAQVKRKLK
ncbi:MAG: NOB1 family endonuclease [Methanomicrobiales archaeon]|nr:NOB1 family endonuclease [Methanomicrobiales archaeon]